MLPRYYGVTSGLDFFSPHNDLEARHSRAMWRAIIRGRRADTGRLVEAARLEIWEHITFWDDVYYAGPVVLNRPQAPGYPPGSVNGRPS